MRKCVSPGCRGEYESREITHGVTWRASIVMIDHVPAAVCAHCGSAVLDELTISRIDQLLRSRRTPAAGSPSGTSRGRGPRCRH